MGSKKKDLEIIYNLRWKNKTTNGDDKANIIGMYDIPATTLNWEVFKSYLLKNSGTVGDDVKVSYITDSNRDFPIESQTDFQIALYAFRRKARMGEYVNLKLDRISDQPTHKNIRHSNDVETQFENNEAESLASTCCNTDTPPDWFISYMSQFKKKLTEDLTATVINIVSNIKPQPVSVPSYYHSRKSKPDCPKRIRKLPTLIGETPHEAKDLRKSLKLECKLERKLEKLENKTKKIKEKKLALSKSSDSDPCQSTSRSPFYQKVTEEYDTGKALFMDAAPLTTQSAVPHMLGGEVYLHQWEVMNTGKSAWTNETSLSYTWGSKALKPLETIISVPQLAPGETGVLAVRLQIPSTPGHYECYWHFHHKDRRFGHWLGCQVIVDPFDLKGNMSVLETSFVSEFVLNPNKLENNKENDVDVAHYSELLQDQDSSNEAKYTFNIEQTDNLKPDEINTDEAALTKSVLENLVRDISSRVGDIKLHDPTDTNCSSDSDNQSIISLSESPDEFVVVPIPDCFRVDPIPDIPKHNVQVELDITNTSADMTTDAAASQLTPGSRKQTLVESIKTNSEQSDNYDDNNNTEGANKNSAARGSAVKVDDDVSSNDGSQKSDIVVVSLPKENEQDDSGYAIVIVDGQKLSIPKKIIKSEYLKASEDEAKNNLTRSHSTTSSVEIIHKEEEIPQLDSVAPDEAKFCSLPICQEIKHTSNENDNERELLYSANDLLSHCSAAGSCFSEVNSGNDASRLFIFPQSCPGYEVVYPEIAEQNEYKWTESDTNYAFANATLPTSQMAYQNIPSAPLISTATTGSPPPLNLSTHDRNPFLENTVHVPNFQQTPPSMRPTISEPVIFANSAATAAHASTEANMTGTTIPESGRPQENSAPIHILPETLVSGAVNVASSAINTARSVINMIVPREGPNPPSNYILQQPGRWVNGHWVSTNSETPREANLQALAEMGFWNRDLNATLLARYNDDLSRVVAELVQ